MEPITREVYLAVLTMLGAVPKETISVHMYRDHVEIETRSSPAVVDGAQIVTGRVVVPVVENGYISRVRG